MKKKPLFISLLHWIVNNKLEMTTIPIPLLALYNDWWKVTMHRRNNSGTKREPNVHMFKANIERNLKFPERLKGFTNLQKAQLLFILSLKVNEIFEDILKNEGHQIELTDPDRLISFFRSQDGSIERRCVHHPAQGVDENEDDAEEPVDEDDQENMSVDNNNYDDAPYFDDQHMMAEEAPQRNEQEHVELNEQEGNDGQQSLELDGGNFEEEQRDVLQRRGIKRAKREISQQGPQGEINVQIVPLPKIADIQTPQDEDQPVAQVPTATSDTAMSQSETPHANPALIPVAASTTAVSHDVTSQVNPAPVPAAVPATARIPVPTTQRPNYPTPTVSFFLKNLCSTFESLRAPVLNEVIESITKEFEKHQNNTNPVSILDVTGFLPNILHFAIQQDAVGEEEETISQKRFFEILTQSVTLLNSPELNLALQILGAKKCTLTHKNKINVTDVALGVAILLRAVCGSKKVKADLALEQEEAALPSTYDVLISFYASVTNLTYLNPSSTTFNLIMKAILKRKDDMRPISLNNFGTYLQTTILLGETENPEDVQEHVVNRRVYLETIYHILHFIGSNQLKQLMEDLDTKMENLDYEKTIPLNTVNLGLGLLLEAITN